MSTTQEGTKIVSGALSNINKMKGRKVIWTGELEWEETADDKNAHRSIKCSLSAAVVNGAALVQPDNWPPKLRMKEMIPISSLVQTIGTQFTNLNYRQKNSVRLHPTETHGLSQLGKKMSGGFGGCIYFRGSSGVNPIIILCSTYINEYIGYILNDQKGLKCKIIESTRFLWIKDWKIIQTAQTHQPEDSRDDRRILSEYIAREFPTLTNQDTSVCSVPEQFPMSSDYTFGERAEEIVFDQLKDLERKIPDMKMVFFNGLRDAFKIIKRTLKLQITLPDFVCNYFFCQICLPGTPATNYHLTFKFT